MELSDELFWQRRLPQLVTDNIWTCEIYDGFNVSLPSETWFGTNRIDDYVEEINIPQISIEFEKTKFNLPNFKSANAYDSISLTFVDDLNLTCYRFFSTWIDNIYDIKKHILHNNWRNQSYSFKISLLQYTSIDNIRSKVITSLNSYTSAVGLNLTSKALNETTTKHIISSWDIKNCYPTDIESINLSHSNSGEPLKFTVKLECERIERTR